MSNFYLSANDVSYIELKKAIQMSCEQSMSDHIDREINHYRENHQVVPDVLFTRVLITNGKKVFQAHTHPRLIYKNVRTGDLVCVVNVWYNQTPEDRLSSAQFHMQYAQQNLTTAQAALHVVLERGHSFSRQVQQQAERLVETSIFPSYDFWRGNQAVYAYFKDVQRAKWDVDSRTELLEKYQTIVRGLQQRDAFI